MATIKERFLDLGSFPNTKSWIWVSETFPDDSLLSIQDINQAHFGGKQAV